jgi:hypothetical protein
MGAPFAAALSAIGYETFITATGGWLNAVMNGAYTIVRNVVLNAFGNGRGGVEVHPVRLNLANWRLVS